MHNMFASRVLALIGILLWSANSEHQELQSMCCTTADGVNYKINTTFVAADCKSKCVCTHDGHLGCVPLCPRPVTKCPIGYKPEETLELAGSVDKRNTFLYSGPKNKQCFCKKVKCRRIPSKNQAKKSDYCLVDKKYYQPGEEFVKDCKKLCRCYKKGEARCVSLCPSKKACPIGTSAKEVLIPVEYSHDKCECRTKACKPLPVKDKCLINGRSYKAGEDFISADCTGSCKCHPGGSVFCVSLCPPEGISCDDDEETIKLQRKVPNSECTCPTWRCLKKREHTIVQKKQTDTCIVGKNTYQAGDDFINPDCSGRCKCYPGGSVLCASLCPPERVACQADEEEIQSSRNISESNCTCPTWKCVKKQPREDKCIVNDHTYSSGEDFVSSDCSGFCKCHPDGHISCVSLCPPTGIRCQPNEDKVQISQTIPNSNCSCPAWKCVKRSQKENNLRCPKVPPPPECPMVPFIRCSSDEDCPLSQKCCSDSCRGARCLFAVEDQVFADHDMCTVGENTYQVGDDFIHPDCSGRCKCYPGGVVVCESLCPPERAGCHGDEEKIQLSRNVPDSNCTCPTWKCVKKQRNKGNNPRCPVVPPPPECPGTSPISECSFDEECPLSHKCCSDGCGGATCVHAVDNQPFSGDDHTADTSDHTCSTKSGKVFFIGQAFADSSCTSRCHCLDGGELTCQPLCPSNENAAENNMSCVNKKIVHVPVDLPSEDGQTNCSCPTTVCDSIDIGNRVAEINDEGCIVGGKTYKPGDDFISPDCSGYCKCQSSGGGFSCVSLCPEEGVVCQADENAVQFSKKVLNSNCTCPAWKCVKREQKESSKWTFWSNWTACIASCGGGLRHRYRSCTRGMCIGDTIETEVCNLKPCSATYSQKPCGMIRLKSKIGGIWPRCDTDGYFTPLQCNANDSQCWCVNKFGDEEPNSRVASLIPQCKSYPDEGNYAGSCPTLRLPPECPSRPIAACTRDAECPLGQKCCSDGCLGFQCMDSLESSAALP